MFFDELNLNDNILDALYDMRFDECTPIQEACIPAILNKKDILGVAQTGQENCCLFASCALFAR